MDMLLGLDMLKKHQCTIDLRKNCLMIGTTGTETKFLSENELPACARLSGAGSGEEGEAAALKASAKEAGSLEDKQLAEALARSASDHSMDTSESKPGSLGASTTASAPPAQTASADNFKESDVANIVSMGFPREVAIAELRKCNGDANLAVANLFAKSLSEGFNKKK